MPADFPLIPEDLAKELDRRFPEKCPDPTKTSREIWMQAGRRDVVRFLLDKFRKQLEPKGQLHVRV